MGYGPSKDTVWLDRDTFPAGPRAAGVSHRVNAGWEGLAVEELELVYAVAPEGPRMGALYIGHL